jgi:putative methyltransferase (TIGR04325 family)
MDKAVQYLKRFYLRIKYYRYGWHGRYSSWAIAKSRCSGYDAAGILEKVKAAALKVKNGEAVYERDAMLSGKIEYSWPLLANLLWMAGRHDNFLSVLDFGGSLGTSYFQNRAYLSHLKKLTWSIVEQANYVQAGKRDITGDALDFFENVEAAISAKGQHDVLLLSCVLPYVEKPFELIAGLAEKEFPYIIIENTYFNTGPGNRLTIQKVPPVYYDASYPAWFLNYDEVVKAFANRYDLAGEYTNDQILYLEGEKVLYRGFVMKLKTRPLFNTAKP